VGRIDPNLTRFMAQGEDYLPPSLPNFVADAPTKNSLVPQTPLHQRLTIQVDTVSALPRYPTPQERRSRLDLYYQLLPFNYTEPWTYFQQTRHAPGLRSVIPLAAAPDSDDDTEILLNLHDTLRALPLIEAKLGGKTPKIQSSAVNPYQSFVNNDPTLSTLLHANGISFGQSVGYLADTWYISVTLQLQELAKQYDTIIAIPKGGLPDAYSAHLLDLNPMIWELHAHGLKNPTSRWVTPFDPERIRGKRVLLLDKDTVTGATILAAQKELAEYQPAALGAYFHFNRQANAFTIGSLASAIAILEKAGVTVHEPMSTPLAPFRPLVTHLHEKLETPLGRLRKATRALIAAINERFPKGKQRTEEMARLKEVIDFYYSLNPLVPGMQAVQEELIGKLEADLRAADTNQPIITIHTHNVLMDGAESLALARYTISDEIIIPDPPDFEPIKTAEDINRLRDNRELQKNFLRHLTDREDLFQTHQNPTWFEEQLFSEAERQERVSSALESGMRRYLYQSTVDADEWTGLTQEMVAKINKAKVEDVEVAVLGYGETSRLIGALLAFGVKVTAIEVLSHVVDLDDPMDVMTHRTLTPTQLEEKFPNHDGRLKVVDVMEMDEESLPNFDLIFGITPESSTIDSAMMLAKPNTRIVFQTFPFGGYELDKMKIERHVASGEFRQVGKWDLSNPVFETTYGQKNMGATVFMLEQSIDLEDVRSMPSTLDQGRMTSSPRSATSHTRGLATHRLARLGTARQALKSGI